MRSNPENTFPDAKATAPAGDKAAAMVLSMKNLMKISLNTFLVLTLISSLFLVPLSAQNIDMDQVFADDEFRWGVQAYHNGQFNNAILAFEKALSLKPENPGYREWLGNAYHRAGFDDAAIDLWNALLREGAGSVSLRAYLESLLFRIGPYPEPVEEAEYVTLHSISGRMDDFNLFSRPSSVLSQPDGSFYVVSFATNEVLRLSSNGRVRERLRGGFEGLNHPFDLTVNEEKQLFITEYQGDRIVRMNPDGSGIIRFGSRGRGDGQFLGPQFITHDGNGHIYVTDQGNRRVSKFTYQGEFLFSFGTFTAGIAGLRKPTGILFHEGKVYVSDGRIGEIFIFDENGNSLGAVGRGILKAPEGLSYYPGKGVLIAEGNRILLYDPKDEKFVAIIDTGRASTRYLKAEADANGNLLAADFDGNGVDIYSDLKRMYSGLVPRIKRVRSDRFPQVLVELSVIARDGTPYVGMEPGNFLMTEGGFPVSEMLLEYAGDRDERLELAILAERSIDSSKKLQAFEDAAEELFSLGNGQASYRVINSGAVPTIELESSRDSSRISRAVVSGGEYSGEWVLDLGIRLAGSTLMTAAARRGIVFLSSGDMSPGAFSSYQLSETAQYLRNNNIAFYVVYTDLLTSPPSELEYLVGESGGESYYLYHPEGISGIGTQLRKKKTGVYILSYVSRMDPDFGRRYLPLEMQVSHFGRSGRDESGYFAPPP